jgi:hypothetical protein
MLDVHPPHQATHTWKDFLIHIATIVVGLLIAVGLEQTVEYFHHRRQLYEAREAVHTEMEGREQSLERSIAEVGTYRQELDRDAALLRKATDRDRTPTSQLVYHWGTPYPRSIAWQSAKGNGAAAYMEPDEREVTDFIYGDMDLVERFSMEWLDDSRAAAAIVKRAQMIGELSGSEREELLRLTTKIQGESESCLYLLGTGLRRVKIDLSVPAQSGMQSMEKMK